MHPRPGALGVGKVLRSGLGRRVLGLLLGCALLPLVSFAWLAVSQVSSHLRTEGEMGLHVSAKSVGMGIAGRLVAFDGVLDLVAGELHRAGPGALARAPDQLTRHIARLFRSVWTWDGQHARHELGDAPRTLAPLGRAELDHLAAGKTLIQVQRARVPQHPAIVLLLHRLPAAGTELLVAEVREDEMWNVEELRTNGAEVVILGQDLGVQFSTVQEAPDREVLGEALGRTASSGTFEWQVEGESHLARYWRLFLKPQFGVDWLVIQSRASAKVLAPLHGFQQWFGLTALLACLVVLFVSLIQIRRTLGPIEELQTAARRVAAGEYSTQVPAVGADELGELGKDFNRMTTELVSNIQLRERTERDLVAARDEALAAARAKADFLTNVSHELRTPLTSIVSAAEILRSYADEDPAVRAEFLAAIADQAGRLHEIVDRVLELTSGSYWELCATDVGPTLADAVGRLPATGRARVTLAVDADLPQVSGDPERMAQLWVHLLDNALRFSPESSPVILRARSRGRECLVEVADRGVGIAEADVQRIFEPFCQVGRDLLTEKTGGTGLGLSLARHIAQRHGGRIEVETEPGKGSVFRVVLPAVAGAPMLAGSAS
jgi:signal transduction histidine kinase